MAKRYGVLPSEFLKLSVKELQFNILAISQGVLEENKVNKKQVEAMKRTKGRRR